MKTKIKILMAFLESPYNSTQKAIAAKAGCNEAAVNAHLCDKLGMAIRNLREVARTRAEEAAKLESENGELRDKLHLQRKAGRVMEARLKMTPEGFNEKEHIANLGARIDDQKRQIVKLKGQLAVALSANMDLGKKNQHLLKSLAGGTVGHPREMEAAG